MQQMPKIQLRNDTATNWTTANPTLLAGEVGVETDTNKFKIGDGSTAWNSLAYQGGDLSNYYTKSQTDELLDKKQNLLTPNDPLTITSYSKNNAVNMTSEDGKIWTENPSTYVSWFPNRDEGNDLATFNDSDMGYIDIPYTIGQIVKLPVPAYTTEGSYGYPVENGGWTTAFGGYYDENQNFCPVFHIHPPSSYSWWDTYFYLHPKNEMRYASRGYEFVDRTTANMGDTYTKDTSPELGIAYFQMREVSGTYTFCEESNTSKDSTSTIYKRKWTYTGADTLMQEVLGKVCAIRIYPGQFSGGNFGSSYDPKYSMDTQAISKASGFDVTSFGLYEANDTLDNIALTSLTNNLFDLGGSTTLTYLDLSIGSGLSVQNGNLVNTNPTAPTVMTGATSSTAGTSGLVPAPEAGDDTKFLSGDGTYKTASTDLSNYYNKTETDTLLDKKQDVLTPNDPLTITNYTKNNLEGFTYTSGNTGLVSAGVTDSSKAYRTAYTFGGNDKGIESFCNGTFNSSLSNYEKLWSGGYIDIPYSFGQVVGSGKTSYSNGWGNSNVVFGKFVNEEFVPIVIIDFIGSTPYLIIPKTDNSFEWSVGSYFVRYFAYDSDKMWQYASSTSVSSISTSLETDRAYGSLYQLIDTGSTIKANFGYSSTFCTWDGSNLYGAVSISGEAYTRIKEVTTARIMPSAYKGDSTSYPLLIDGIGLWNSENAITASTFTTENALGTNLFDISGATSYNYLDLHIGSGLAIQNGTLVNTVDVSNKVTGNGITNMVALTQAQYDALVSGGTVDTNTFYVIVSASS